MLTALVLICSLALTPELRDCNHNNALAVVQVPERTQLPARCFLLGQAYIAETSIGQNLTEDERVKVECARSRSAN
jgi:hypothetical protein